MIFENFLGSFYQFFKAGDEIHLYVVPAMNLLILFYSG